MTCFKAYDIRGRIPDELNDDIAYRIGRAYAEFLQPKRVCVGRDVRLTSASLAQSLIDGLTDGGADVFDIALCGTEEIYFATSHYDMDGGIMVTASHNPMDYNGMKLVREQSRPISGDTGLDAIHALVEKNDFSSVTKKGEREELDIKKAYIDHLLSYVDLKRLKSFKVVVNSGNGCAGPIVDLLEPHLPFEFVRVHHDADGSFPNGIPNPLLPENRDATSEAVVAHQADVGIAWDGDFDRCFFFDGKGNFVEGYYIVGLLAKAMLCHHPGAKIIHDPRLTWNTIEVVTDHGGVPVQSKTGHAFIKERMRQEDAIYGGEMSAHHYFKDFAYCDSGMIPWLLVLEIMAQSGKPLSELVKEMQERYPASGEINRKLTDPSSSIHKVEDHYKALAKKIDFTDGLSMEFADWRFNLRCSNTEPVVRLNVESCADVALMETKTKELLTYLV